MNDNVGIGVDDSDETESIKIEIQIPKKQFQPSPPPPPQEPDVHIIQNTINVVPPSTPVAQSVIKVPARKPEPKQEPFLKDTTGEMKQKDEPGTLDKVRLHGSRLEKTAVNAAQKFNYRGITVKDSRAS